jgi:pimeloyl-ACP methyl ester carboxylesterase
MVRFQRVLLFIALSTWSILPGPGFAQLPLGHAWETKEMNRTPDLASEYRAQEFKVRFLTLWLDNLDANHSKTDPPTSCVDDNLCFKLFYFTDEGFSLSSTRKNILFIAGGPGQIVLNSRHLGFLETDHNVVYFDLRGTGLSVIPNSNRFDKFLKVDYVVEDLERLRIEVLKGGKWDAIYGFSYGTIVAQRYAHKHPNNVNRLILEAPIIRDKDFAKKRARMALDNLERVYRLISSEPTEPCDCQSRNLRVRPIDDGTRDPGDNMCFLNTPKASPESGEILDNRIKAIRARLEKIYEELEQEYGVIGFVTVSYDEDLKNDRRYKKLFGYPKEFIFALRDLQNNGAPEKNTFMRLAQIEGWDNVALVLGYYAMSGDGCPIGKDCMKDNPFLKFVTNESCQKKNTYPKRIIKAKKRILENASVTESQRALYVFGLNDGLHPWLYELLNKEAPAPLVGDCLSPDGLAKFKQNPSHEDEHEFLRKIANKIGFDDTSNRPCLWNPGKFQHEVQSLVLSGGADAVTAGCQAEVFFNDGLMKGKRALIEFPGMGHGLDIPFGTAAPSFPRLGRSEEEEKRRETFRFIIKTFLEESAIENYRNKVQDGLKELEAKDRTPPAAQNIAIGGCAK